VIVGIHKIDLTFRPDYRPNPSNGKNPYIYNKFAN